MTLPSQSARPSARSAYMYSRRRHRIGPVILIGLMVVIGGYGGWRLWGPGATDADSGPPASPEGVAQASTNTTGGPASGIPVTPPDTGAVGGSAGNASGGEPGGSDVEIVSPSLTGGDEADGSSAGESETATPAPDQGFDPPPRSVPSVIPSGPDQASTARAFERLTTGLDLHRENRLVEARRVLSDAYMSGGLSRTDADRARETLQAINDLLVFSPTVVPGDPYAYTYTMKREYLGPMLKREGIKVNYRFIERINRTKATRLREGQGLKLVRGPMHAVISKRDYRMDLYMGDGAERVFVTSLSVGLGEYDSTPAGRFRLLRGSKVENPAWTNPRTGEQFGRDDPENPIGEFWIGLEGVDPHTEGLPGYGIHGTIEPQSIGRQMSMGCVRLLPDDIALVYELLTYPDSTVEIVDDRI